MVKIKPFIPVLILLLSLSGCGGMLNSFESPYYRLEELKEGSILHVPTGTLVDREELFTFLSRSRVIYVGETHDNLSHHRAELEIIKAMDRLFPGRIAVGMEMFTTPSQPMLDRWVKGDLPEEDFYRLWLKEWGIDYGYYRDILEYIRERRIPLIALNAPKDLVDEVREKGLEGLPPDRKKDLPEIDRKDPYHRAYFKAFFKAHDRKEFERFYDVSLLWEETMAERIADYLKGEKGRKMIVLAGSGHVKYGMGIPRKVFRRLPEPYTIVLLTVSREALTKEEVRKKGIVLMDVSPPKLPLYAADFVWVTGYEKVKRPRLGISVRDKDGKVVIAEVLPGSVAERSGIRKGDIVKRLDGKAVKDSIDLIYRIRSKGFGEEGTMVVERKGREVTIRFTMEEKRD